MKTTVSQPEEEGFPVVNVEGKVIRENQGELRKQLEELVTSGHRGIALNLEGVNYMDSAGLGCCAAVQKGLKQQSGSLVVFGASPNIEKMWKLIRLDLVIPLVADKQTAFARLAADTSAENS